MTFGGALGRNGNIGSLALIKNKAPFDRLRGQSRSLLKARHDVGVVIGPPQKAEVCTTPCHGVVAEHGDHHPLDCGNGKHHGV
jgi:hypothetical protein